MENYTCLTYFYLAKSFKCGCYSSLETSRPALWERVVKMGSGLMKTLKIELDNNIRKNNVKSYIPLSYSSILVASKCP